jgi:2-dehydro-3-deoxyphosphooctonate aldolase (KDO 8-P synthase)
MLKELPFIKNLDCNNFFLIAGPCIVENEETTFLIAETIKKITEKLKIPFIFKASYKKANRSSIDSFTGIGDEESLRILQKVKDRLQISLLTDIHSIDEINLASTYADILQIPAFLCRQTELLIAAGRTGKIINIKKGQFLSPEAMQFAADKIIKTGNNRIMLTERGTTFGYHDLVVDFRGIYEMKKTGFPVILDITHSLQQPNQSSGITGGKPELIETLAKAAIATGADGIFIETHPEPAKSKSDGANMLALHLLEPLLVKLVKIREVVVGLS